MRRPLFFWLLLIIACFLGALYFWRPAPQRPAENPVAANPQPAAATTTRIAPSSPPAEERYEYVESASTAPVMFNHTSPTNGTAAIDARLKYRLSNTPKTVDELVGSDQAILLENALIDSSLPVQFAIPESLRSKGDPGSYIVQSRGPIDDAFRAQLSAAGARIVSYLPNNAYLVRASAGVAQQLAASPRTQAVLPFEPYYKLKSSLLKNVVEQRPLREGSQVIAVVFSDAREETVAELQKLGATIVAESPSPFGPQLTLDHVTDVSPVAVLPGVQFVQLASKRVLVNDLVRQRIGVAINATAGTNYLNLSGLNVTVAINDSGVDINHPDFQGRLFGPSLADIDGHGTHVAGIIAGNGTQSLTVSNAPSGSESPILANQFRGQAPLAHLYSLPALGGLSDFQLQEAAARTNALINNNSWAYAENGYDIAAASYDAATRDSLPGVTGSQAMLFVFAAGNSGGGAEDGLSGLPESIQTPATAKNIITVGALEQLREITNDVTICETCDLTPCTTNAFWAAQTDTDNEIANFSGRGNVGIGVEGKYGRFKPDVVAPGVFVVSTRSQTWDQTSYYNPTNSRVIVRLNLNVPTNSINFDAITVPCNAVQLLISAFAVNPFADLPIYVREGDLPTTANFLGFNSVALPPGAPLIPTATYFYGIGNPTNVPVIYDTVARTITTNDNGNSLLVLSNLNSEIGPWYRYESGTSMAAPAVSGMLALMQDLFTNYIHAVPSPALLKAMLISGARSANPNYNYQVNNLINLQGWGVASLTNSVPGSLTNGIANQASGAPVLIFDQSPAAALSTGNRRTFNVRVAAGAQSDPLRFTLVWTDPPGNPSAGVKLVNNLDLVVTNLDTREVFFGNDIPAGANFTFPWATNQIPNVDLVNNVENVIINAPLGTNYSVTVVARRVNVNAVTAHPDNVVQDYALVVSASDSGITNALTIVNPAAAVFDERTIDLTIVTNSLPPGPPGQRITGGFLTGQHVGANSPLVGTTTAQLGANTIWGTPGTNGVITLGVSNQWHFYVLTNELNFTNAAFITFLPPTLSVPRMGVTSVDEPDEISRVEADIDIYVSLNPLLLKLDPATVSAADKSVGRGGTEFVVYTNAVPQGVYYVGIHSEDQQAAEYGFFGGFSESPFDSDDENGKLLRGFPVPAAIPDGSPSKPGVVQVLAIATSPISVRRVVVTNVLTHENYGDLLGNLNHNQKFAVLHNHTFGNGAQNQTLIYEDNGEGDIFNSRHTDGPGSLTDFIGEEGLGVWFLNELDNALSHTGRVEQLWIHIDKQFNTNGASILNIQPNSFAFNFIDVPPEATNLTISVVNISATTPLPVQLFVRRGALPTLTVYDYTKVINPPGDQLVITKSDLPPLRPGRYYIGVYNPNAVAQRVQLVMTLGLDLAGIPTVDFTSGGPTPLLDDAIVNSDIFVTNRQKIVRAEVGVAIVHPRVSDLAITLISPSGKRLLLYENRGGPNSADLGGGQTVTNYFGTQSAGDFTANTNVIGPVPNSGTLIVDYDFFVAPDTIDIFYDGAPIYTSGGLINGSGTISVPYGPGTDTTLTIVMNQGNNTNNAGTAWVYTPRVVSAMPSYFVFTENSNSVSIPLKFSLNTPAAGTNFSLSDFDTAIAGVYPAPAVVDGWTVDTNRVSVINDPATAQGGSQFLALENGNISRPLALQVGSQYVLNFFYRLTNSLDINGSFENPPGRTGGVYTAGQTFGGWTVESGDINDVLAVAGGWPAADGGTSLDMNGNSGSPGSIYRDIITTPGQSYVLKFSYSGNPAGGPNPKFMQVSWGGAPLTTVSFDTTGFDVTNLVWAATNITVTGTGTNRLQFTSLVGSQFGPLLDAVSLTPIASAEVSIVPGPTTTVTGTTNWQQHTLAFSAPAGPVSLQVSNIEPGMLFDTFTLTQFPDDTFGMPEETLKALIGDVPFGNWRLEVWDNRANAPVGAQLINWQLRFIFEEETAIPISLPPFVPVTNNLPCGMLFYTVDVPSWALYATNILISANAPVNVWFNQNTPPVGTNPPDFLLIGNGTTGASGTLRTGGTPPLIPGSRYYLGVQNLDCATNVTVVIEVDYDITALTNAVPYTNALTASTVPRYFLYDVSSNATAVTYQLLSMTGNLDLVARRGPPLPTMLSFDYRSINPGTADEDIVVFTNSAPVPLLAPGRWFLGVFNTGLTNAAYTILATEYYGFVPPIVTLTNSIPYTNNNAGTTGADADFYRYVVSPSAARAQFEIFGNNGDMTLVARKGLPLPVLTNYAYISANPFTNNELIVVITNSAPVPLSPGNWFLTAINVSGVPVAYNIMASEFPLSGRPIVITDRRVTGSGTNLSYCITWDSVPGAHYFVEGETSLLAPWVTISPTITATSFSTTYCIPLPSIYNYFRVVEGVVVSSYLPPPSITVTFTGAGILLRWNGPATASYQAQWASSALPPVLWNSFTNVITSTNGQFSFLDDGSQTGGLTPPRYYRVLQLP